MRHEKIIHLSIKSEDQVKLVENVAEPYVELTIEARALPVADLREFLERMEPDVSFERRQDLADRMLRAWDQWDTEQALIDRAESVAF